MGSNESVSLSIPVDGHAIEADLTIPLDPKGSVIFAHGSGSSRHSPRNRYVAQVLNQAKLVTLLLDLLTPAEELIDNQTLEHRFNIPLLANRLVAATDWFARNRTLPLLPIGYFGASTGAAAALIAASIRPSIAQAVVSRGGRPDLADFALSKVAAPTLFIVGELDQQVLELNRKAAAAVPAVTEIQVVPRATHLFEEPGALEQVARLASEWFTRHLTRKKAA